MLNSYFLLLLIYFSLSGYSILTKVIIFKKIEKNFENLDVFYGFLFLILLTLFLNFIIPIKYISIPTIILGLILTLFFLIKKKIIFKDIRSFVLILLSIIFITHHHWPNIDTEVYHLQIINKVYHEKIIFGFANIEEKYGMNSVWQIFLSLFNISKSAIPRNQTLRLQKLHASRSSVSPIFISHNLSPSLAFSASSAPFA